MMQKFPLVWLSLVGVVLVVCSRQFNSVQAAQDDQLEGRDYWLRRKAEFYRDTTFLLNDFNLQLLGKKRTIFEDKSSQPKGHLPFWFDYELFKKVFNKPTPADEAEELARHHVYMNTCLRAIKQRTLFRMLAGTRDTLITSDADRVSSARVEFALAERRCPIKGQY